MAQYMYNVNCYYGNSEHTFKTNDIRAALTEFFGRVKFGVHTDLLNGYTGEVLAIANDPHGNDFTEEVMALTMVGYLAERAWGDEIVSRAEELANDTCDLLNAVLILSEED